MLLNNNLKCMINKFYYFNLWQNYLSYTWISHENPNLKKVFIIISNLKQLTFLLFCNKFTIEKTTTWSWSRNPCFSGQCFCNTRRRCIYLQSSIRVAILVLVDSVLQWFLPICKNRNLEDVAILVLVDSVLQSGSITGIRKDKDVAILVLVDSVLQCLLRHWWLLW